MASPLNFSNLFKTATKTMIDKMIAEFMDSILKDVPPEKREEVAKLALKKLEERKGLFTEDDFRID